MLFGGQSIRNGATSILFQQQKKSPKIFKVHNKMNVLVFSQKYKKNDYNMFTKSEK